MTKMCYQQLHGTASGFSQFGYGGFYNLFEIRLETKIHHGVSKEW